MINTGHHGNSGIHYRSEVDTINLIPTHTQFEFPIDIYI